MLQAAVNLSARRLSFISAFSRRKTVQSISIKPLLRSSKKRAERIKRFDQAHDFIIPSEFNPQVGIEAKITEDDGTARDKVTRIQHLNALSTGQTQDGSPAFEVIACIGGRGFGERSEDMKKLI